MDLEAIWKILEGVTAENVYQAYSQVSSAYNIVSIGTILGVAVSMFLFFRESSDAALAAIGYKDGGFISKPNWAKLLAMFKPTAYIMIVVIAYPHVLDQIEKLLTVLTDSLGNEVAPEANIKTLWKQEAEQYQKLMAQTSAWEFGKKASLVINYYLIMIIKPFLILLEQDAYSLFLGLRYLYLIILELFGGVALALYISKDTRTYTYTWLKHMMFNYAMVGVFGIANMLAIVIIQIYIGSNSAYSYNILIIAFGAVMKLFFFKQSFNLLKSNIF